MAEHNPSAEAPREPVRVLPVPLSGSVICLFVGIIRGLLTHWHRGRSVPCEGVDECPTALHSARTVWKGYAAVYQWSPAQNLWKPHVLEITEVLEEQLRGRSLPGEVWCFSRSEPGRKSSPVQGEFLERRFERLDVTEFDIASPLLRFYHVRSLLLGVPNPTPPKLLLPSMKADRPRLPAKEEVTPAPRPTAAQMAELRRMAGRVNERSHTLHNDADPAGNGKP